MRPFKIGEVTRRPGCTVKAIRFCEAMELLPRPARSPADYRLCQFARLTKDLEGFLVKMRRATRTLPAELWRAPGDAPRRASPCAAKIQPKGGRR